MTGHARWSSAASTSRAPSRHLAAAAAGALVAGALSVLPAGAWAAGTTRYVGSTGCSDAGPGTSATAPFCTISAAVKVSAPGDTVDVAAGTYAERVDVAATKTGLVITGHGAVVEANGQLYGFAIAAGNVQLSGFEVDNATTANVFLNGSTGSTVSSVVTKGGGNGVFVLNGGGNVIDQVTVSGAGAVGILIRTSSTNKVTASTTHDNANHGLSVQGGDGNTISGVTSYANSRGDRSATGIDVRGFTPTGGTLVSATNTVVEASTAYGNEDSGIETYPGSQNTTMRRNVSHDNGDHGIDVAGAPNTTVVNNTLVNNTNVGLNVEASGTGAGSTGTTLRNNISAFNGENPSGAGQPGEIRVDTASATGGTSMDYDLAYRASAGRLFQWAGTNFNDLASLQTATGQEQHGLVGDPRFVSATDYHLTSGSPAIDAGTPAGTDLGAFEFGSKPTPTPASAALTATPSTLTAGGTSILDASGSTGTGTLSYAFTCGNATTAVVDQKVPSKATCTYPQAQASPYTATVTVTDSNGKSATATTPVTVNAAATAPTAALTATPSTLTAGGTSILDASGSTGTGTLSYAFTCGNATTAVADQKVPSKATCTYAKAGTYNATVTVTDSNKNTATANATVTVADAPAPPPGPGPQPGPAPGPSAPVANLAAVPAQLVAGGTATLDASGSHATAGGATISAYRFDCGNGVAPTGTGTTATCSYPQAGTFTAKVTVTDSLGSTASATTPVMVSAAQVGAPHARLRLVTKRLSQGRLRVVLLAGASSAAPGAQLVGYRFFCGNGHATGWVESQRAACTFRPRQRAYVVTLRVRDSQDMTDQVKRRILNRRR